MVWTGGDGDRTRRIYNRRMVTFGGRQGLLAETLVQGPPELD